MKRRTWIIKGRRGNTFLSHDDVMRYRRSRFVGEIEGKGFKKGRM